jgi:serine/threonine-protein kinase
MAFVVNQRIGNYECLGIIEKPKVGVTYKVRNVATGEIELLKALPGATSRDPESVARLLREIRIQTRLSHPNILEFRDAFDLDGGLVMTTEFVEAPTLADLCREEALPPKYAIEVTTQVLEALEQAHALGIVHRGITADHVAVKTDGVVKLGGFDLAKPAVANDLTRAGTVAGDPRYISPEQVLGQRVLDARSDLYSVGVLLYLALTGRLPFEAQSDFDILAAKVGSEPPAPSRANPAISPELDEIVLIALRNDPAKRFTSAKQFRAALEAARSAQPHMQPLTGTSHPAVPCPIVEPQSRRPLRAAWIVGLAVVIVGVAVVVWLAIH